uniref:Uncharacterized protein n=1 Tax=Schistosoma curassoni TaxID=6186 RepID=A0A183JKH0_9TREM
MLQNIISNLPKNKLLSCRTYAARVIASCKLIRLSFNKQTTNCKHISAGSV